MEKENSAPQIDAIMNKNSGCRSDGNERTCAKFRRGGRGEQAPARHRDLLLPARNTSASYCRLGRVDAIVPRRHGENAALIRELAPGEWICSHAVDLEEREHQTDVARNGPHPRHPDKRRTAIGDTRNEHGIWRRTGGEGAAVTWRPATRS
jgi:hypothetical protein